MTPLDIRIKLLKTGLTYSDIAKQCNTSRQLVRYAIPSRSLQRIHLQTQISEIRKVIAKAINRPVEEIWPSCAIHRRERSGGQEVLEGRPQNSKRKAA